ncbi:ferredoxin [Paenibacillus solani]|uniref:Ferredoxin n=1 Tax=Paenibacillus solani TaxID=1705565 RepID=A0A0M1P9T1_9BACL|nr:ferredoxin [Paenibacillus solani]
MIELSGREVQRSVAPVLGITVLDLAERNDVDWNSFCKRGTCARCRCLVIEGIEYLSEPNLAEERRLDPEEMEEGYRLGCQSKIEAVGPVKIKHTPYF